jgi:hypothetical protein
MYCSARALRGPSALLLAAITSCGEGERAGGVAAPLDAAVSPAVSPAEAVYCVSAPQCSSDPDLYVLGASPFGSLELDDLNVSYLTGDTVGTRLIFQGSSDGRPFLLLVRLVSDLAPDGSELAASPAGNYWAESAHILRTLPDGSCAIDSLEAEVQILEHEAPVTPALGDRIYFGGTVLARGGGWQLEVEFEARRACGTTRDD